MMLNVIAAIAAQGRRVAPVVSGGVTALQDWTNRSTAAGVIKAVRFTVASTVTNNRHIDGAEANVVFDATDGIIGDGCLRIDVPAASGSNPGSWRVALNDAWATDAQGFGSTAFYIQYRVKLGPNRMLASVGGGGFKMMNLAEYRVSSPNSSFSNTVNEIVFNNQNWRGAFAAYRQDGTGFPDFSVNFGAEIKLQSARDNGAGIADPFARYCLYQSGNASPGCWFLQELSWFTVYARIELPSLGGSAGNRFDCYVARAGETSYTQLFNNSGFLIGADPVAPLGPNGIWLLPYDTSRTSASYSTWHKYDQLIVSLQPIACPL